CHENQPGHVRVCSHSQSRLGSPALTRESPAETPSFKGWLGFRLEERSKTEPALERALLAECFRPNTSTAEAAPTCEPTPLQPVRSNSVSASSLRSTTGSPEKGRSWSARARSSTRRILPEIVFGSSANSRRRMRLYGARFSRQ